MASMDLTSLSMEVKSKGIKEAADALKELGEAAKSVDKDTRDFVIAQSKLATQNVKTASSSEAYIKKLQQKAATMGKNVEATARYIASQKQMDSTQTSAAISAAKLIDAQNKTAKAVVDSQNQQVAAYRLSVKEAQAAHAEKMRLEKAMQNQQVAAFRLATQTANRNNSIQQRRDVEMHTMRLREQTQALDQLNGRGSIWHNTLKSMAVAATAYMGVNMLSGIVTQSDAWSMMSAKLKVVTGSMESAKIMQQQLFDIAQRTRIPLAETAQLYNRMSIPMKAMGKSSMEAAQVVEGVGKALKLAGATGAEASSAMLQFSQSINAGRLNGQEFNAISEASPNIIRAIRTEMEKVYGSAEVARQGLKNMGSDGKITAEIMVDAIKTASNQWNEDFKSLPITVDSMWTKIKNSWQKAMGEVGEDTKFNTRIVEALDKLEQMLPAIAKTVGNSLAFLIENFGILVNAITAVGVALTLLKIGSVVTAMYTAATAVSAVTMAAGGLRAALLVIGVTPLGLALTALAGVVALSTYAFSKHTRETDLSRMANDKLASNGNLLKSMELERIETYKRIDAMREARGEKAKYANEIAAVEKQAQKEIATTKELTEAQKIAAKADQDIAKWKKSWNQKSEYGLPDELKKARTDAQILLKSEEKVANQTRIDNQTREEEASELAIAGKKDFLKKLQGIAGGKAQILKQEHEDKLKSLALDAQKNGVDIKTSSEYIAAKLALEKTYQRDVESLTKKESGTKKTDPYAAERAGLERMVDMRKEAAAQLEALQSGEDKRTEGAKQVTKFETDIKNATTASAKAIIEKSLALAKASDADQQAAVLLQAKKKAQDDANNASDASLASAQAVMQTQLDLLATYGMTEGEIEKLQAQRAQKELERLEALSVAGDKSVSKRIENQKKLVETLKITSETKGSLGVAKDAEEAQKRIDAFLDPTKAETFGDALKKAFGGANSALGGLVNALDDYSKKQAMVSKQTDDIVIAEKSGKNMTKERIAIGAFEAKAKVAAYGEMIGASKKFFKEGSTGYKVLGAAEKAFRVYELASSLQSYLLKSGLLTAFTGLFIASKATETTVDTTYTATSVVNSGIRAAADGVAAVAKAIASMPFPLNIAAGAATLAALAAIGVKVAGSFGSSGSGGMKAADAQKSQGTGSILGDAEAKSTSLTSSLEALKSLGDTELSYTKGMLTSLRNIESSMKGLASLVVRSTGAVSGTGFGIKEGTSKADLGILSFLSPLANLWGKTTTSIIDSGLKVQGSLADLQAGKGVSQYASVDTTKSSWFGLKKSTSNSVVTQSAGNDINNQFAMIFTQLESTLKMAATGLGITAAEVDKSLSSLVISSDISLKGLTGQALQDAINNVISKAADDMANTVFKGIIELQQIGEGAFETLIRVSSELTTVNQTFERLGQTLFSVDMMGIKSSQTLLDLFGGIEEFTNITTSYFEEFYSEQERLQIKTSALKTAFASLGQEMPLDRVAYRSQVERALKEGNLELYTSLMKLSTAFTDISPSLADSAGGIDKVKDSLDKLSQDAEKWLGLRNRASSLKDSIDSAIGNPTKDPSVRISQLWDMLATDVTIEQKLSLAEELKDLTLAKYQVEKDSITKLIEFGKQLRSYVAGLKVGSLSPLTTAQKLSEAQAQFRDTLMAAQGGDEGARNSLQGKSDTYLNLARTALASSTEYASIFSDVTNSLDSLGIESMTAEEKALGISENQLVELTRLKDLASNLETTATGYYNQSVVLLTNQVTLLDSMYKQMGIWNGISDMIGNLPAEIAVAVLGGNNNSSLMSDSAFVESLYASVEGRTGSQIDYEGFQYWMEKVAENGRAVAESNFNTASAERKLADAKNEVDMNKLIMEVQTLNTSIVNSTGAIVTATYVSNEINAAAIVNGTTKYNETSSWKESNKAELI